MVCAGVEAELELAEVGGGGTLVLMLSVGTEEVMGGVDGGGVDAADELDDMGDCGATRRIFEFLF